MNRVGGGTEAARKRQCNRGNAGVTQGVTGGLDGGRRMLSVVLWLMVECVLSLGATMPGAGRAKAAAHDGASEACAGLPGAVWAGQTPAQCAVHVRMYPQPRVAARAWVDTRRERRLERKSDWSLKSSGTAAATRPTGGSRHGQRVWYDWRIKAGGEAWEAGAGSWRSMRAVAAHAEQG